MRYGSNRHINDRSEFAQRPPHRHPVHARNLGGLDLRHTTRHGLDDSGVKFLRRVSLTLFGGVPLPASLGNILGSHDGTTAS